MKHLGHGAYSDVFEVNSTYMDLDLLDDHVETCALKVLRVKGAPRVPRLDNRLEELETLLHIQHEHVIQYFAVHTRIDCNEYGIFMEFCSGKTITEFIKSNIMYCSIDVIVDYTTQLVSGLRYLHEKRPTKFIHGNIKSLSILMKDSTGKILKIAGLDSSFLRTRVRSLQEQMDGMRIAYNFMSPEMIRWLFDYPKGHLHRSPSSSTDIWSLGWVVLEMYLARQGQHDLHFSEGLTRTDYEAIVRHERNGFPLIPQIPEDMPDKLKVLTAHCLKVNPDDRPTAATLLKYVEREYFKCADGGIQYYFRTSKVQLGDSGTFGVVHQVNAYRVGADFIEQGPRNLALKTFFKLLAQDEIDRITRSLPKLDHRNIVKYLTVGCFEPDQRFTLIMECCSGGTLTQAAKMGLLVEQQKEYANQLISGIYYLHVQIEPRIVHKDLKGNNVVFEDESKTTLKICDVDSCSTWLREASQTVISRLVGTRGFMSPEMQKCWMNPTVDRGRYRVGRATDIWSLGAVVLEMYCQGRLIMPEFEIPAAGETFDSNSPSRPAAVALSIDIPLIPEDMEQELKGFVSKCMALGPKDRPTIKQLRDKFS
ncbi:putative Mitogen-activated protein kinase kinase kinase A [Hypsibius exemplaris]|uniref:non-specific serine/threonine protein kinase n=1 Tax=Hypsibius exemplaris TaxID=2072580 RepID=A0A9X6NM40_HYPEX|nr:putative Mitogen-activated protein kinase kinase kinase A [Hypsibius exemplaris]